MEKKEIEKIVRKKVEKEFPDFKNVIPVIKEKELSVSVKEFKKVKMKPIGKKKIWVAVFRKIFESEDGGKIRKIIRATIDKDGKIIKISESH